MRKEAGKVRRTVRRNAFWPALKPFTILWENAFGASRTLSWFCPASKNLRLAHSLTLCVQTRAFFNAKILKSFCNNIPIFLAIFIIQKHTPWFLLGNRSFSSQFFSACPTFWVHRYLSFLTILAFQYYYSWLENTSAHIATCFFYSNGRKWKLITEAVQYITEVPLVGATGNH